MARVRIFSDPKVKEEMLDLRRKGHSFSYIARKYNTDHTTIMFHCQAAGLALTETQKEIMYSLIREGFSVEEVGIQLDIAGAVIEMYCSKYGVAGSDQFQTRAEHLKELKEIELTERQEDALARKKKRELDMLTAPVRTIKFKTDSRGVSWRTGEKGEWICLGRSEYKQDMVTASEKKRRLNQKRLDLLKY